MEAKTLHYTPSSKTIFVLRTYLLDQLEEKRKISRPNPRSLVSPYLYYRISHGSRMPYKHMQNLYLGKSKEAGPPTIGYVRKRPRVSLKGLKEPRLEERTIRLG